MRTEHMRQDRHTAILLDVDHTRARPADLWRIWGDVVVDLRHLAREQRQQVIPSADAFRKDPLLIRA